VLVERVLFVVVIELVVFVVAGDVVPLVALDVVAVAVETAVLVAAAVVAVGDVVVVVPGVVPTCATTVVAPASPNSIRLKKEEGTRVTMDYSPSLNYLATRVLPMGPGGRQGGKLRLTK
jgi:hypothetical protein